jgi:hypothetical protein
MYVGEQSILVSKPEAQANHLEDVGVSKKKICYNEF